MYALSMTTPPPPRPGTITRLLDEARRDLPGARDSLFETALDDLKAIARAHLRRYRMAGRRGETSVVNDAILRLLRGRALDAPDRARFYGLMKAAMKSVLVDELRKNDAQKNGGGWKQVPLIELHGRDEVREILPEELLGALEALEYKSSDAARVFVLVEVFGSTIAGAGEAVGRTYSQARGDYDYARTRLKLYLSKPSHRTDGASPRGA